MCYFKSLVNEHKILVSLFRFIRGPVNNNNWLFPRLATKQSMGKVSLLTWHSNWFLQLSASVMIGQWHQRYLHIKVRKNAASRLGIPIGSFDWLHLLTVVNNITWFDFGIYTPQLKELCQGSLVYFETLRTHCNQGNPWKNGSVLFQNDVLLYVGLWHLITRMESNHNLKERGQIFQVNDQHWSC